MEAGARVVVGQAHGELVSAHVMRPLQGQAERTLSGASAVQHTALWRLAHKAVVLPLLIFILVFVVAVAVERCGAGTTQIDGAGESIAVAQPVAGRERHQVAAIFGLVRMGEDGLAAPVVHALRDQTVADQIVVGMSQGQRHIGGVGGPGELAEQLTHFRWRMIAPAVLFHALRGQVPGQLFMLAAMFQCAALAPERTPIEFRRATGMRIATLGLQCQRTTQGIQAVQRIGARDQQHVGDGGAGNQVPVHHITKGFVDPHTIEKHGQPLRRAEQWRCGETAVVKIGLVRIALDFVDIDAGQATLQLLGERLAAQLAQLFVIQCPDIGRHLVPGQIDARQRSRGNHVIATKIERFVGMRQARQDAGDGKGQQRAPEDCAAAEIRHGCSLFLLAVRGGQAARAAA